MATPSCKNELVVELECLTFPASRWGDSPLCTLLLTMLIVRYPCLSAFNPMPSSWHSHWWRSGPIRKECLHILQVPMIRRWNGSCAPCSVSGRRPSSHQQQYNLSRGSLVGPWRHGPWGTLVQCGEQTLLASVELVPYSKLATRIIMPPPVRGMLSSPLALHPHISLLHVAMCRLQTDWLRC